MAADDAPAAVSVDAPERGRSRLRGTVRVRTTAAAVLVVGAALLIAAVAMVTFLRESLTADVRTSARLRAHAIAKGLESRDPGNLKVGHREEEFIQIQDAEGGVIKSSANLERDGEVLDLKPGEWTRKPGFDFEDDAFLAVAVEGEANDGSPRIVIVGRTLEAVGESSGTVAHLLGLGIPLLLVVVGAVIWRVVGRALAPVEAMRAEVEGISTRELDRRVPVPAGKDEIARLAVTMNRMLSRLESSHNRQRRFISDSSHELRSPVATIREHAEVALEHPGATTTEELATVVLEENSRLQRLVDDLLLLTRIDEGTLQFRTESVDLDDLLFEEAQRLRNVTNLRIDSMGVSAGRVSGDRRQLDKLVRNLTENAARHARREVSLSLRESNGHVVMAVDDDGDGIPTFERERVFERFVRLQEARDRDSGGSGLGLAIVAEIAAAHGASVQALDSPLGGTRFAVRFPRVG